MGFFKDYNDIKKQTKEISRNSPCVGDRMAEGNQTMVAATAALQASTATLQAPTVSPAAPSPGSVPVEVQVVSAEPPTGYINGNPIVNVSVLVLMGGRPPVPATQSIVVPALQVHRLSPGTRLAARVDPRNIQAFVPDWNAST